MAFEDFLRSIPLVHRHIMRTRTLMHENMKLKNFIERNGLNVSDILSDTSEDLTLPTNSDSSHSSTEEQTLQSLAQSLRAEQKRSLGIEGDLYVLQIDYDALLKLSTLNKKS